jgi:hypothetical protein
VYEGWGECAPGCEGVGGDLGEAEEFFALDGARIVLVFLISICKSVKGVWGVYTLSSFMKRFRILSTSLRLTASWVSFAGSKLGADVLCTIGTLNNVL